MRVSASRPHHRSLFRWRLLSVSPPPPCPSQPPPTLPPFVLRLPSLPWYSPATTVVALFRWSGADPSATLLECVAALRYPTIARTRSSMASTGTAVSCSSSSRSSPFCSSSCHAHPPLGKSTPRMAPRGPRIMPLSSMREAPAVASMSSISMPT
jgi:hypothetical protein